MRGYAEVLVIVLALAGSGCYHASVVTGLEPGGRVVDKPWAMGWAFGLVPPSTVDAAAECPSGVAMVETELSFLNQIVSALTGGIVTPMHIRVTCAASRSTAEAASDVRVAPTGDVVEAMTRAAELAVETGEPVRVRFD